MAESIDKIDVVEALAEALDDTKLDGLGHVLAGADSEEFGALVLQVWPTGESVSVDFMVRVTRMRKSRTQPSDPDTGESS